MAKTRASWSPIVDGDAAERVRRVVLDIADVLRASNERSSFPDGAAARALLFGYLAEVWPDDAWSDRAGECLEAAIDHLAAEELAPVLFHGFVGTAWVVEHLQGHLLAPDDDDPNLAIDEALLELTAHASSSLSFELMHGLTGIGLYAWERLHRPSARLLLERVVARLDELAVARDGGRTWLTRADELHVDVRPDHPEGRITLGSAHGVPPVLTLLALACDAGIAVPRARPLLDDGAGWLLGQRLVGADSIVPSMIDLATGLTPASRLAWCYGDAGVGASLLWAARAAGDDHLARSATAMLLRGAARERETSGIIDAGFCHGAAGLMHLFNRASQATGDARLRAAALSWLDVTLAYRTPGGACAGYRTQQASGPLEDESLLSGIAGIGLSLLAAITGIEPAWDRVFACAIPPR